MLFFETMQTNDLRVVNQETPRDLRITLGVISKDMFGTWWFECLSSCVYSGELRQIANKLDELNNENL